MTPPRSIVPPAPVHLQPLLAVLREPGHCAGLDELGWDRLIREARGARLLGVLQASIARVAPDARVPDAAQRLLAAGRIEARFRQHKTLHLLASIEPLLGDVPAVLLKGASYLTQGLALAQGRMPSDVDVLVPRASLDAMEAALLDAGWQYTKTTPYDQHYYRAWSHELAPLQAPGQALELDLHHTIVPPLGRLRPDTQALFDAAVPIAGTRWRALCGADQVLLAAAHLFQDSDCTGRLRDLVDIDGLIREHAAADTSFWPALAGRAHLHGFGRPLWYALTFARAWLITPVPSDAGSLLETFRPPAPAHGALFALVARTLPQEDADGEPTRARRWASRLLNARAAWLRMPPALLAYHAANKFLRSLRGQPAE